jgi:hypothetical protein
MSSKVLDGARKAFTIRCGSESPAGAASVDTGGMLVLIQWPLLENVNSGDDGIVTFGRWGCQLNF